MSSPAVSVIAAMNTDHTMRVRRVEALGLVGEYDMVRGSQGSSATIRLVCNDCSR
jgi:hypothetical protein